MDRVVEGVEGGHGAEVDGEDAGAVGGYHEDGLVIYRLVSPL